MFSQILMGGVVVQTNGDQHEMTSLGLIFALIAMVAYALWAIGAELATRSLAPEIVAFITYSTGAILLAGYLLVRPEPVEVPTVGSSLGFAMATGAIMGIGTLTYYHGLQFGDTTVVTTIAALYFVLAAILDIVVLGNNLGTTDALGLALAAIAVTFISL
jgi:uncharacterized membrane protein